MTAVMITGKRFIQADAASRRALFQALHAVMLTKPPRCRSPEGGEF